MAKGAAVTGVGRHPVGPGGNAVYNRLRARTLLLVLGENPNTNDRCYLNLTSTPDKVAAIGIKPRCGDAARLG